jgi:hypothetical protein
MVDRFLEKVYQGATVTLSHACSDFSVSLVVSEDAFTQVESSDDFEEPSDRLWALVAGVLKFPPDVREAAGSFDLLAVEGVAFDKAFVGIIAITLKDAVKVVA